MKLKVVKSKLLMSKALGASINGSSLSQSGTLDLLIGLVILVKRLIDPGPTMTQL